MLPHPSFAQCGFAAEQFRNIALETSKPFVAEFSTNFSSPWAAALRYAGLRSAARDSERRVRLVLAAGKSTVKSPNDAAPDAERQMIFICDPTTRTTITLDTANKSATVRAPRGNPPDALKPLPGLALSFCAGMIARRKRAPGTQSEGLGQQTISGYDAVGLRLRYEPGSDWYSTGARYSEMWCSDSLGAVVRQAHGRESRDGKESSNESTMQNIERREPDPSLFQIPYDYTILKRVEGNPDLSSRPGAEPPYPTIVNSSPLLLSTSTAAF
jgi:hypothetical protein